MADVPGGEPFRGVRWLLLAGASLAAAAAVHAVARSVPWTPPVHEKSVWTGVWTGEASGT